MANSSGKVRLTRLPTGVASGPKQNRTRLNKISQKAHSGERWSGAVDHPQVNQKSRAVGDYLGRGSIERNINHMGLARTPTAPDMTPHKATTRHLVKNTTHNPRGERAKPTMTMSLKRQHEKGT